MKTPRSFASYTRTLAKLGGADTLSIEDLQSLHVQRIRVFAFMRDGKWHFGPQIVRVAGGSEGLRRLRELREIPGVTIEKRRDESGRAWWYRMKYEKSIN